MVYKAEDIWTSQDSLQHYGVIGMKWGVRNDTDRAANRLARYGRKLDKARARYEMASQRTFKLSKKTDKLNRKAGRLERRSDRIASGKSDFGIWTNRRKKAESLAVKAYDTSERKSKLEKQLYKSAAKANKYRKRVARYEKKVNKLMKRMDGVKISSLDISDKNKLYVNDLLYGNVRHDDFYSDYLSHYGVKGMKWGVRKAVVRTGRAIRSAGGAVKNSTVRAAGGIYRTGSLIRRLKNRRAIKSGNVQRINKRISKMTNQELEEAVARVSLINQLKNNSGGFNNHQDRGVIRRALDKQIEDVVNNVADAAVSSAIGGNDFSDTFRRKYGYKTTSEKNSEKRERRLSDARNTMNIMAINNEVFKYSSENLKRGKKLKQSVKNGRDLYNTDLNDIMESVKVEDLESINYGVGQKKK